MARPLFAVGFVALLLAACGGSQEGAASASLDASADAGEGTGGDAAVDIAADVVIDSADEDSAPVSTCSGAPDGGALGPPEVIASGIPWLMGIGASDAGPVWADWAAKVYLSADPGPPKLLFSDGDGGGAVVFRTSHDWFGVVPGFGASSTLAVGNSTTGSVATCAVSGVYVNDMVLDRANMYTLGLTFGFPSSQTVTTAPLASPCSQKTFLDQGIDKAENIAVDDTRLYFFLFDDPTKGHYRIQALPKSGGVATTVATAIDPEDLELKGSVTLLARNGTVAWAHPGMSSWPTRARFVEIVPAGASVAHTLVDEPDGIACGRDRSRPAIALDEEYLYWATLTGFVKRIRLCGGIPEVVATNQEFPTAVAVDDNAIYWLDYGGQWQLDQYGMALGEVMRMRKLDTPGYANTGDAGPGDADASD